MDRFADLREEVALLRHTTETISSQLYQLQQQQRELESARLEEARTQNRWLMGGATWIGLYVMASLDGPLNAFFASLIG